MAVIRKWNYDLQDYEYIDDENPSPKETDEDKSFLRTAGEMGGKTIKGISKLPELVGKGNVTAPLTTVFKAYQGLKEGAEEVVSGAKEGFTGKHDYSDDGRPLTDLDGHVLSADAAGNRQQGGSVTLDMVDAGIKDTSEPFQEEEEEETEQEAVLADGGDGMMSKLGFNRPKSNKPEMADSPVVNYAEGVDGVDLDKDEVDGFPILTAQQMRQQNLDQLSGEEGYDPTIPSLSEDSLITEADFPQTGDAEGAAEDREWYTSLGMGIGRAALELTRTFFRPIVDPIEEGILAYGFGIDDPYNSFTQRRLAQQREVKRNLREREEATIKNKLALANIANAMTNTDMQGIYAQSHMMKMGANAVLHKARLGEEITKEDQKVFGTVYGTTLQKYLELETFDENVKRMQLGKEALAYEVLEYEYQKNRTLSVMLGGQTMEQMQFGVAIMDRISKAIPGSKQMSYYIGMINRISPEADMTMEEGNRVAAAYQTANSTASNVFNNTIPYAKDAAAQIDKNVNEQMKALEEAVRLGSIEIPEGTTQDEYLNSERDRIFREELKNNKEYQTIYSYANAGARVGSIPATLALAMFNDAGMSSTSFRQGLDALMIGGGPGASPRPRELTKETFNKFASNKSWTPLVKDTIPAIMNGLGITDAAKRETLGADIGFIGATARDPRTGKLIMQLLMEAEAEGQKVDFKKEWMPIMTAQIHAWLKKNNMAVPSEGGI